MDATEKFDLKCAEIQAKLERLIARRPDNLELIDDLWRVQTLRFENAIEMNVWAGSHQAVDLPA